MLYYDSRADEGSGNGESLQNQERRRMYPENYTMQNMLELNLTSQMQHRCEGGNTFGQRTQFFYKNELLSQRLSHRPRSFAESLILAQDERWRRA